ncbi:hypothetical protein FOZ60_005593 [Perkinsus olseni]|uniref:Phosphatidate phosphatase APP1 catalytic domain-containing protein n=1 Tax=Perkinsus olseni TaxID=32597 RepID=A0A7J6NQN1_PEROL|nr:hypothetical protein FOZ60_005593 [Perkinsus olseni]
MAISYRNEEHGSASLSWRTKFLWLVLAMMLTSFLGSTLYSLIMRPFVTLGAITIFFCLMWYCGSDTNALHSSNEFENIFWTLMCMFSMVVFLALPDSPLNIASISSPSGAVGIPLLVVCGPSIALWAFRRSHRAELTEKPGVFLRRVSSQLLQHSTPAEMNIVKEAVASLDDYLRQLDHKYLPSTLNKFYNYNRILYAESKIIQIFREATSDKRHFSYLVLKSKLPLILYKVKDHPMMPHRRMLIQVLSTERLHDENVPARALVLHALQQLKVSSDRETIEIAVRNIICGTHGRDLTELKALIDSKGCYQSLHKLVYHDLKTRSIRHEISRHMITEAHLLRNSSHSLLSARDRRSSSGLDGGPSGLRRNYSMPSFQKIKEQYDRMSDANNLNYGDDYLVDQMNIRGATNEYEILAGSAQALSANDTSGPYEFSVNRRIFENCHTKVLSDVDDTLVCSGGMHPAGCDTDYPRKTVYPGVGAFYRELDLGVAHPEPWPSSANDSYNILGNLVFLSARPHVYKDLTENKSYEKFIKYYQDGVLHCVPTLLPGSMTKGADFLLRERLEPLAENKYTNFKEYASLYPEYDFVFIGDNGQADVRAAAKMMEVPFANLKMAYIHKVQDGETYGLPPKGDKRLDKFYFFTNYVQAGTHAYEHQLISFEGIKRLLQQANDEFDAIEPSLAKEHRQALREDIDEATKECLRDIHEKDPLFRLERHQAEGSQKGENEDDKADGKTDTNKDGVESRGNPDGQREDAVSSAPSEPPSALAGEKACGISRALRRGGTLALHETALSLPPLVLGHGALVNEISKAVETLSTLKTDWHLRQSCLEKLARVVLGWSEREPAAEDLARFDRDLAGPLVVQIRDDRSAIVRQASMLCIVLGASHYVSYLSPHLLPGMIEPLLKQCTVTVAVVAESATQALYCLCGCGCRKVLEALMKQYKHVHPVARRRVMEVMSTEVCGSCDQWAKCGQGLQQLSGEAIRAALHDNSPPVRQAARLALCRLRCLGCSPDLTQVLWQTLDAAQRKTAEDLLAAGPSVLFAEDPDEECQHFNRSITEVSRSPRPRRCGGSP